ANSDAGSSAENGGVDAPRTAPAEQADEADDNHEQNGAAPVAFTEDDFARKFNENGIRTYVWVPSDNGLSLYTDDLSLKVKELEAANAALQQRLAKLKITFDEAPLQVNPSLENERTFATIHGDTVKVDWNGEWKLAAECRAASP